MNINVTLTDAQLKCLKHELLDVNDWVQKAVQGKVNNCKKRMIREWLPKLMEDPLVDMLPADEDLLIDHIVKHSGYQDRLTREDEQKRV